MIFDTKLVCPKCGCESPFKMFQTSEEILEVWRLVARFGKNWPWTEEYLHCFQSAIDKPLKPARIKILLEELLGYIKEGGFRYDGKPHLVRPDAIYGAIRHVAQTNKVGFKNHNYLKKVAIDFNLKMIQKDESQQHKKEDEAMFSGRRDPAGPLRIGEILDKIGR